MREYETVFVLHPSMDEKEVEAEIQAVSQLIESTGGKVEEVDRWGRRRLAYEIQKVHEGTYTLIRFQAAAQTLKDLERRYRLNERLLRHLTVLYEGLSGPPPRAEGEQGDRRSRDGEGRERSHGAYQREDGDFELPRSGFGHGRDRETYRPRPAEQAQPEAAPKSDGGEATSPESSERA